MHVLMCAPLFRISGSTGRIMQQFGVLLGPLTMRFTHTISGGYLQVSKCSQTSLFEHICSLPLVYRPKGVLLVGTLSFRNLALPLNVQSGYVTSQKLLIQTPIPRRPSDSAVQLCLWRLRGTWPHSTDPCPIDHAGSRVNPGGKAGVVVAPARPSVAPLFRTGIPTDPLPPKIDQVITDGG